MSSQLRNAQSADPLETASPQIRLNRLVFPTLRGDRTVSSNCQIHNVLVDGGLQTHRSPLEPPRAFLVIVARLPDIRL